MSDALDDEEDVLEFAEKLARLARAGMVDGFVCLIQLGDEHQFINVGRYKVHAMIGQLEIMKVRIIDQVTVGDASSAGPKAVPDDA